MKEIDGGRVPMTNEPILEENLYDPPSYNRMEYQEVNLMQRLIEEDIARVGKWEEQRDMCSHDMIRLLSYALLSENFDETLNADHPKTWWDHVKRDLLNPILKYIWTTWKVSYELKYLELKAQALYPLLMQTLPKDRQEYFRVFKFHPQTTYVRSE